MPWSEGSRFRGLTRLGRRARGRDADARLTDSPTPVWPAHLLPPVRPPLPGSLQAVGLATRPRLQPPRLPYLAGLDGLRALAVIAVVLYHAGIDFLPAGFLGVEIFFVISGYLITSLLLAERAAKGRVSLRRFWLRRARRLLPALFLLVAAVLSYFAIFLPNEVATVRGDAVAAIGYVTNWAFIVQDASYFDQVGRPSPLLHLWSLAIEEQFYLVWPLLFVLLISLGGRRLLLTAIVLGIVGSTLLMALLFQPFADVSRIYYGTDTRAAGLLFGAALAVIWRAGALPAPHARTAHWLLYAAGLARLLRWTLDFAGLAALGGLAYIIVTFSEFQQSLYQGGFALVGALTLVVIAATVAPGGLLGRVLGVAPLRWVGLRSYSIYLWHWPIFVLTRPDLDVSMSETELLLFRLGLTLALSEISYRFVEMPIRDGALGGLWGSQRQGGLRRQLRRSLVLVPAVGGAAVLGIIVLGAQPAAPPTFLATQRVATVVSPPATGPTPQDAAIAAGPGSTTSRTETPLTAPTGASLQALPASSTSERAGATAVRTVAAVAHLAAPAPGTISARFGVGLHVDLAATAPASAIRVTQTDEANATPAIAVAALPEAAPPTPAHEVGRLLEAGHPTPASPPAAALPAFTAIGDSVMLGAAGALEFAIAGIGIDAEVARHVDPAIEVLVSYLEQGVLGETVILHLGNNGPMYEQQFDTIMSLLSDRTVVFVNVRVPRQWQDWNNDILRAGVGRYPNASLINWYRASESSPGFFWDDGYHLRPEGAAFYAELIAAHLPG